MSSEAIARIHFLIDIARQYARRQPKRCPYCRGADVRTVGRRRWVLQLVACQSCGLRFRFPLDDAATATEFYDVHYYEPSASEVPRASALEKLIAANFAGSRYDIASKVEIVRAFGRGPALLDYGCSWGYTVHQFRAAGFDAIGFEPAPTRAAFARDRVGVPVESDEDEIRGPFDVIFANHVLEHMTTLGSTFDRFRRWLRADGLLVAFAPNCGGRNAREQGAAWGPMIGRNHTLALDAAFFRRNLPRHGFDVVLASDPYDIRRIADAVAARGGESSLDGDELLAIAEPVA